jgi:hypothetical protein
VTRPRAADDSHGEAAPRARIGKTCRERRNSRADPGSRLWSGRDYDQRLEKCGGIDAGRSAAGWSHPIEQRSIRAGGPV